MSTATLHSFKTATTLVKGMSRMTRVPQRTVKNVGCHVTRCALLLRNCGAKEKQKLPHEEETLIASLFLRGPVMWHACRWLT